MKRLLCLFRGHIYSYGRWERMWWGWKAYCRCKRCGKSFEDITSRGCLKPVDIFNE